MEENPVHGKPRQVTLPHPDLPQPQHLVKYTLNCFCSVQSQPASIQTVASSSVSASHLKKMLNVFFPRPPSINKINEEKVAAYLWKEEHFKQ